MRTSYLWIIISVFCLCSTPGQAGEYVSEQGYRIEYPDGWEVVSTNMKKQVQQAVSVQTKTNTSSMDVVIRNMKASGFAENVVVEVIAEKTEINEAGLSDFANGVQVDLRLAGIQFKNFRSQIVDIGKYKAFALVADTYYPTLARWLRQVQVVFSEGGRTFSFTLTAQESNFEEKQEAFAEILESFHILPH